MDTSRQDLTDGNLVTSKALAARAAGASLRRDRDQREDRYPDVFAVSVRKRARRAREDTIRPTSPVFRFDKLPVRPDLRGPEVLARAAQFPPGLLPLSGPDRDSETGIT
jgi:hypothetical protein